MAKKKKSADKTAKKQRGRPFKKGQSGNPKGRPRGSFSFTTRIKQYLQENPQKAEAIMLYFVENEKMRELLWKMIDGMPKQPVGLEGEIELPVRIVHVKRAKPKK